MTIDKKFEAVFGGEPEVSQSTPGRVNLIGEHTDYNGGLVLPTVLEKSVSVALRRRNDNMFLVHSSGFDKEVRRPVSPLRTGSWSDYAVAPFAMLVEQGLWDGGVEIFVESSLPHGSGLSSSAALIVGILKAVARLTDTKQSDVECAQLAQRVENHYLDVPCGIMDQMAVAMARPGQALKLDTRTLEYELLELPVDYSFVVVHSGVYRRLDEGRYAERRKECETAAEALGVSFLCRLTQGQAVHISGLESPLQGRARHAWSEHLRVEEAATALSRGDMGRLGKLMTESHISMRDDFEVSLPRIDEMVNKSVALGALGSRLTGGGFGGCFVSLLKKDKVHAWKATMKATFPEITIISPS